MKIVRRFLANCIDIIVFIGLLVVSYLYIVPIFIGQEGEVSLLTAGAVLLLVVLVYFALQYPFAKVNQTLGKAFFGLRIVSTNSERPLTVSIILQRELFAKVFTCYFMCLPVLFGKTGQHDVACQTEVR